MTPGSRIWRAQTAAEMLCGCSNDTAHVTSMNIANIMIVAELNVAEPCEKKQNKVHTGA